MDMGSWVWATVRTERSTFTAVPRLPDGKVAKNGSSWVLQVAPARNKRNWLVQITILACGAKTATYFANRVGSPFDEAPH